MPKFEAISKMQEIMTNYYVEAKTTKEKPIAWVTSGAPVEFLQAMDIIPIYPENYAAMCASSHTGMELIDAAEAAGYSQDICSYARTDFGAAMTSGGPVGGLPEPDFLLCSTNICKTVIKWYEAIARVKKVPLFVVDTPFLYQGLNQPVIDYCVRQFKDLELFLADLTKRPFDHERFHETLFLTAEATELWRSILNLGETIPSPINAIDGFIHMAPIVTLRGTQTCVDYYKLLLAEAEKRVRDGVSAIPEEKYRVLWDNLPIWFKLKRLGKFFAEQKCAITAATYTNSWGGPLIEPWQSNDIYEVMASQYLSGYINLGFADRIKYLVELIETNSLTGFVMHSNRSCKPYSIGMYRLQEEVTHLTGKPGIIIEADQNDERAYSDAQTETRLEAFFESMDPVATAPNRA